MPAPLPRYPDVPRSPEYVIRAAVWQASEVELWLRAIRERGLNFRSLDRDMSPLVYARIVADNKALNAVVQIGVEVQGCASFCL